MKNSILRKVLATALSAVTLLCTGFTTSGQFVGTSVSVSAANVYGDFEYVVSVNNDNTIAITNYTGNGGDVVIPSKIDDKSVTYIGTSAFTGCTGLTSITIPDSVTSIGWNVFESCTGLTSITIPDSVTSIGGSIFFNCTNLINIDVEKNNPNYSSQDGVLFNKDKTRLIAYPPGKKGNYIIPDGVTLVTLEFCSCNNLTSITIPDSVTAIYGAGLYYFGLFHGCTSLESIHVSPNNSHYSSVDGVLFNKDKTELISYPMAKKENFYNIPNSVNTIKGYAFEDCTKLTNITMPNSVNYIGESAFLGCVGLKNITLPDSVKNIERCALGYFGRKYNYNKIDNFTIYGVSGSVAETYANKNNIPFVSDISAKEIVLGGTVTVNAKAVLGDGDYTYAVLYKKKADTKWTVKQNYSTNDTIVVKPAKATDYDVCVKVKNGTGKIVKKFFEVKVNAKLKNTSTISATTIKKGDTVTLNGSATGGMGDYTYAVLYKKKAETKWTTRQGYKDNSEILVRPYTNTDYDICIKVKDKDGTISKKYFTVTVTK